jgi:hypothetical protein
MTEPMIGLSVTVTDKTTVRTYVDFTRQVQIGNVGFGGVTIHCEGWLAARCLAVAFATVAERLALEPPAGAGSSLPSATDPASAGAA